MKNKSEKSVNEISIRLFAHHAFRYKRYAISLIFTVLATVIVMDFIQPIIQANVLDKISKGQYNPNDLWSSFGTQIIQYAVAVIMTGIVGWRIR